MDTYGSSGSEFKQTRPIYRILSPFKPWSLDKVYNHFSHFFNLNNNEKIPQIQKEYLQEFEGRPRWIEIFINQISGGKQNNNDNLTINDFDEMKKYCIRKIKKKLKDNVQERWLSQKKIFIDLFVENFYCFKEIEQQTIFEFKQIDRFNEYLGYLKLSNHDDDDDDEKRAFIQIEEKIIENILKEFIQEKITNNEINLNEEIYKKHMDILINYLKKQSIKDSQEGTLFEDVILATLLKNFNQKTVYDFVNHFTEEEKKGKLPDFSPSQQQQNNKKPNSIRYNRLPEWSKNHIILIKKGRNSSSLNCNDDLEFIKKKESGTIIKPNESTRPDCLLFLSPQKIEEEEKEEEQEEEEKEEEQEEEEIKKEQEQEKKKEKEIKKDHWLLIGSKFYTKKISYWDLYYDNYLTTDFQLLFRNHLGVSNYPKLTKQFDKWEGKEKCGGCLRFVFCIPQITNTKLQIIKKAQMKGKKEKIDQNQYDSEIHYKYHKPICHIFNQDIVLVITLDNWINFFGNDYLSNKLKKIIINSLSIKEKEKNK
ncbi:fantastic four-like protein [Anaeramoeba flamelloides]|uniref:Fantastic four-like protein n=1 Tax=Anaeramoeba flamelloides TaxID=1746091 RepID=A0AAV7YFY7_9EUKA|nr:fantastic four-like protein [Anaeramoeba flamelloides]